MLGVVARQRPDAVRAQELLLVEHLGEHPAKLRFVQDGTEPPARMASLRRVVDEGPELRARLEKPVQALSQLGVLRQELALESRRSVSQPRPGRESG
jgi:hypothetical protein